MGMIMSLGVYGICEWEAIVDMNGNYIYNIL